MTGRSTLAMAVSIAISGSLGEAGETAKVIWPKAIEVKQGELLEMRMSGADLVAAEGRWGKEKIFFYPIGNGNFAGLIGADVEAKPAASKVWLRAIFQSGTERQSEIPVKVKAKAFRTESFNVPPGFDQMTAEALDEIRREQTAFARAFEASEPERLWDAPFVRPVAQAESASSFGSRRIINGTPRLPHSGTDLSAPAGTEVLAANHGRVVLVGSFFFAGGSVVLDHGGGLFTLYFHLADFNVEAGSMVKKGDVVGLSGATGRVTGPHLHWGARLGNARIEPFELLKKISPNSAQNQAQKALANKTEQ